MSEVTLVTGASGFIGRCVLEHVRREPATKIRVMVRNPAALGDAAHAVDTVVGDVRDQRALAAAVKGVHTVLHLAAHAQGWAREPSAFRSTNVEAVRQLLELAGEHAVRRIVHVSTILALPPYRPAAVNGPAQELTWYEATKQEGERLVEAYVARGGDAVIVHPTRVYGPGPLHDANSVTRALLLYLRGRLRVRLDDGDALGNYVHVADVAAGIVLAARRGRRGAHYVLGGEDATFAHVLGLASELTGIRRRTVPLPVDLALLIAGAAEWWGRLGGTPFITRSWVRVFLEDRRADIGPARADLGYSPRGLREGLGQTFAWLRATGALPA